MYYLLRVKHSKTWLIGLSQLICLSVNLFVIWSDMIDSGPTTLANNNSCYQIFIRTWKHLDRYMWHHIFPCEQRPHFQSVRRAQTKKKKTTHTHTDSSQLKKEKLCWKIVSSCRTPQLQNLQIKKTDIFGRYAALKSMRKHYQSQPRVYCHCILPEKVSLYYFNDS